jgi:hypothetical protein
VKPGTVSNAITITPGSTACAPAICSGGDAIASATLSQGGIPLAARGVKFEVVSGDFLFITSAVGAPETLGTNVTTITDQAGLASARIRAGTAATNQTGILQITDLGSGAFQRTSLFLAQSTAAQAGFFTIPSSISYTGPNTQTCATSATLASDVFVYGGTPPYKVSNTAPNALLVSASVISVSGGSVRVTPSGVCLDSAAIGFTDAAGRTISVTVSNTVGTVAVPAPPAFDISPTAVTLGTCTAVANVIAVGGQSSGVYTTASNSPVVTATTSSGGLISIRRTPGTDATLVSGVQVAVTDGATIKSVAVTLTGAGAGICP